MHRESARLPASPADVSRYIEHLDKTQGRTLATVRLPAVTASQRHGGHDDPTTRPQVKATLKRLAKEYGKLRKQARRLTFEELPTVKATARIQHVHQSRRRRKRTKAEAANRFAVDLALL